MQTLIRISATAVGVILMQDLARVAIKHADNGAGEFGRLQATSTLTRGLQPRSKSDENAEDDKL